MPLNTILPELDFILSSNLGFHAVICSQTDPSILIARFLFIRTHWILQAPCFALFLFVLQLAMDR